MSAAEKLKALDEVATKAPWILQDDWTDYGGIDSGPEGAGWIDPHGGYSAHRPDNELMVALRNALPQIVALVKAAELLKTHGYGFHWNKKLGQDVCANITENCPLCAALAALDEALSPPTGGSP